MRKLVFLLILLLSTVVGSTQELLIQGGGGFSKKDSVQTGNYGFGQIRLMFGSGVRVGPYFGLTKYGSTELYKNPHSASNGTELSYGLSLDFYGPITYSYSTYAWINTGFKTASDKYNDGTYKSLQKTNGIFLSGGWFVTDEWSGWLGNNRLLFDLYFPLKSTATATWKGDAVDGVIPYDKKSIRLVLESGIKRFGNGVQIEPLIHLGYGNDFGRQKNYYEIGGGIDLGILNVWYRDILKLKVFWRQDFKDQSQLLKTTGGGTTVVELNLDVTSFIRAIKKN